MDAKNSGAGLSGSEGLIAASAITLAACVVLAYVTAFFGRTVGDPRDWGAFGDYVGGLVNPICGLATAVLVVLTLRATRQEAHDTRQLLEQQNVQMKRDAEGARQLLEQQIARMTLDAESVDRHHKLENLLMDGHRKLEGLMTEWREHLRAPHQDVRLGLSEHGLLHRFEGTLGELFQTHYLLPFIQRAAASDSKQQFSEFWRETFNSTANLLCEFARYFEEYDEVAGNKVLTEFYRHRLTWAARFMEAAGQIDPQVARALSAPWGHGDIGKVVRLPHPPAPFPDQAGPT